MKEYPFEGGKAVDLEKLEADFLPLENYKVAHAGLVQFCHDILVAYEGKFLLVKRTNEPAKNTWWSLGGRVKRGMPTADSAKLSVKLESGLEVQELVFLDFARTYFQTDPFGHGKGTDTVNALYFAKCTGNLKLDDLHTSPLFLEKEAYSPAFKATLHPYMQHFLDLCIEKI